MNKNLKQNKSYRVLETYNLRTTTRIIVLNDINAKNKVRYVSNESCCTRADVGLLLDLIVAAGKQEVSVNSPNDNSLRESNTILSTQLYKIL